MRPLRVLPLVLLAGCGGGGHSGSSPSAAFAANSIVYGVANGAGADYAVDEVAPTGGTPKVVFADVSGGVLLFALDPHASSRYAVAADPTGAGTYGIYLSKDLTLSGATALVAPGYTAVSSLAVTRDGAQVVYTATTAAGASELFVVPTAGGTPVDLGAADGAAVSPADGDTIAYVAPGGGSGDDGLFLRSLAAGASGSVTPVAGAGAGAGNHALPAFSADGTRLAYWTLVDGANALTVENRASGATVSIPGVGAFEPQGVAFSPDGATLSFVGESGSTAEIATSPSDGSVAPTAIVSGSSLLGDYGFFWTDANGRTAGGIRGSISVSRARKSRVPG